MYTDLLEAIRETSEHILRYPNVNILIAIDKNTGGYIPVYALSFKTKENPFEDVVNYSQKAGDKVIAVFATIR